MFSDHLPKGRVRISPLGHFDSIIAFESAHTELLRTFESEKCEADDLNAIYYKPGEVIRVGRFYELDKHGLAVLFRALASPTPPDE